MTILEGTESTHFPPFFFTPTQHLGFGTQYSAVGFKKTAFCSFLGYRSLFTCHAHFFSFSLIALYWKVRFGCGFQIQVALIEPDFVCAVC